MAQVYDPTLGQWVPATTEMLAGAGNGSGSSGPDRELVVSTYSVKTAFTGASVGDTVTCTQVLDVSATTITAVATVWYNQTTAAELASAPAAANLTLVGAGGATEATVSAVSTSIGQTNASATPSGQWGGSWSLISLIKGIGGLVQDLKALNTLTLTKSTLLNAVSTVGFGSAVADTGHNPSFDVSVIGTGTVGATVVIEGRNTALGTWITLATVTLSGTTTAADGFALLTRYAEYRGRISAISGTGAAVTVTMGA